MQKGQSVIVVNFEEKKLPMRVVGVIGDVIQICKDVEFKAAQREGREPRSVGFKKEWVEEVASHK